MEETPSLKNFSAADIPENGIKMLGSHGICLICRKELTSETVIKQHIAGKNHRKAYTTWIAEHQGASLSGSTFVGVLSSSDLHENIYPRQATVKQASTSSPSDDNSRISKKCYTFDPEKKRGICFGCKEEFGALKDLKKHCQTDKHKIKEEEWNANFNKHEMKSPASELHMTPKPNTQLSTPIPSSSSIDNTKWHYCEVCNKWLNSSQLLEQHKQSPRHKKQEERQLQGISQFSAEKTLWKQCDVCGKKVNSDCQLMLHKKSHEKFTTQNIPQVNKMLTFEDDVKASTALSPRTSPKLSWAHGWHNENVFEEDGSGSSEEITEALDRCSIQEIKQSNSCGMVDDGQPNTNAYCFPYSCDICGMKFTGERPYQHHMEGQKHAKRLKQREEEDSEQHLKNGPFKYYCDICDKFFCTKRDLQIHREGKKHESKVIKTNKADVTDRGLVEKEIKVNEFDPTLIKYKPRSYQVTLYKKAVLSDCVCFLPTGTGKTVVSVMVLSKMLEMNPRHSATFLVDKVLLASQQFEVIKKQIGEKEFIRYDPDREEMVVRQLKIALICGTVQKTDANVALCRHDVIVATAAYYENLLDSGSLCWEHNCLVILDESHHCAKQHPYNALMQRYHQKLVEGKKPKILGLTASPTGKNTREQTEQMLRNLLRNLGGVKLITVPTSDEELRSYCPNIQPYIKTVSLSEQESSFRNILQQHLIQCYKILCEITSIQSLMSTDIEEDVIEFTEILKDIIYLAVPNKGSDDTFMIIKNHTQIIVEALLSIGNIGLRHACSCLEKLNDVNFMGNFSEIKRFLDCSTVKQAFEKHHAIEASSDVGDDQLPIMKEILHDIINEVDWNTETEARPLVLLLVSQRRDAKILTQILEKSERLRAKNIKPIYITGHGKNSSNGMSVKKQDRAFADIKQHNYQVLIATSIAEEGIDFPECELVIQMVPPKTVKSLVQIRGRARKHGSKFITICRDPGQVDSLNKLMLQERFMIRAVEKIIEEQSSQTNY